MTLDLVIAEQLFGSCLHLAARPLPQVQIRPEGLPNVRHACFSECLESPENDEVERSVAAHAMHPVVAVLTGRLEQAQVPQSAGHQQGVLGKCPTAGLLPLLELALGIGSNVLSQSLPGLQELRVGDGLAGVPCEILRGNLVMVMFLVLVFFTNIEDVCA